MIPSRIAGHFSLPEQANVAAARTTRLLKPILWSILALVVTTDILFFFVLEDPAHSVFAQTSVILATMLALVLMYRGYVRLAAGTMVSVVWVIVFISALRYDGVSGFAFTALVLVILMAGLLLGEAFGLGVAVLSIIGGIVLYVGEMADYIPFNHSRTPVVVYWFVNTIYFVYTTVLLGLYTRTLNRALSQTQKNEQSLSQRNQELQAAHHLLSQRAAELTETNAQLQTEIAERQRSEMQLQTALAEKEILLQEIHHRVKNNLQVVASLLSLQVQHLTDSAAIAVLSESESRVRSMAIIHEHLYKADNLAHIDFGQYTDELCHRLLSTYRKGTKEIGLTLNLEQATLAIDTAIPCGLLVNELISNALKHAFPNGHNGNISVEFRHTGQKKRILRIQDNGIGFPPEIIGCISKYGSASGCSNSLGLKLVESLVKQLKGSLSLVSEPGNTEIKIEF